MAKIAIPLAADFEDAEYAVPRDRLRAAGHHLTVIGTKKGEVINGKKGKEHATVDATAGDVSPEQFDLLLIPGGYSPDHLRLDRDGRRLRAALRRVVEARRRDLSWAAA